MLLRFLVLFLTIVAAGLGQPGLFGPVSTHLQAGDFAPDLIFTNVLSTPGPEPWSSANLAGQVTVVVFFPDTSHNLQSVSRWNALVDQFASQQVQFVWITAEDDTSLAPWLKEHPLKGWVFRDSNGETGRAYGLEVPDGVIVGADRRILGFDPEIVPSERTLNAALEGRITTTPPKPGMAALQGLAESNRVLLHGEPRRMPRPDDHKPDFPPSYVLHVSESQGEGGNFGGDDFQSFQNYELRDVVAALYDVNPVRVQLPAALDDGKHYDFSIRLPKAESRESMNGRIRQGIQDRFRVTMAREARVLDAYVVTAPDAKLPAAKAKEEEDPGGGVESYSVEFQVSGDLGDIPEAPKSVGLASVRGISVKGSIDKFCHALEGAVDRPVVNESKLEGEFEFNVKATSDGENDFLERLKSQLGISVTGAPRSVEMVVLKAR